MSIMTRATMTTSRRLIQCLSGSGEAAADPSRKTRPSVATAARGTFFSFPALSYNCLLLGLLIDERKGAHLYGKGGYYRNYRHFIRSSTRKIAL